MGEIIEVEDALGLDTYGYPQIAIMRDAVRITLGWFFIDDEYEGEPASYVEQWIDAKGKQRFVVDVYMGFSFDFVTKLRDYGNWIDPPEYDRITYGAKPYFVYADHHIRKQDRLAHFIRNLPFRLKQRLHFWALSHLPYYSRLKAWVYQRKCEKT